MTMWNCELEDVEVEGLGHCIIEGGIEQHVLGLDDDGAHDVKEFHFIDRLSVYDDAKEDWVEQDFVPLDAWPKIKALLDDEAQAAAEDWYERQAGGW